MSQISINDQLGLAYSNVGLLANSVWNFDNNNTTFQKANLQLWIRCNEVEQRLIEEGSEDGQSTSTEGVVRTVRDTIPTSRLASYNNYSYNEERESMYIKDEEPALYIPGYNPEEQKGTDLEVWMLPEVEEEFKRLTCVSSSSWNKISPREPSSEKELQVSLVTSANEVAKTNPCRWLTTTAWLDQLLTRYPHMPETLQDTKRLSLFKEELATSGYSEAELQEKLEEFPCPCYSVETNQELDLHTKINSDAVRRLWGTQDYSYGGVCPRYSLNVDVPEFQPTPVSIIPGDQDLFQAPYSVLPKLPQYPPIFDDNYESEIFPYGNPQVTAHGFQFQQSVASPLIYSDEEKILYNIPVFLGPPATYFNVSNEKGNFDGFVPINISEQPSYFIGPPDHPDRLANHLTVVTTIPSYQLPMFSLRNPQELMDFLEKNLSKLYNTRAEDLKTIYSASGKIAKAFQNVQQNYHLYQEAPNSEFVTSQKPLYSDVLVSDNEPTSLNDSKYDELEREALEQYSGSDTMLLANLTSPTPTAQNWAREQATLSKPPCDGADNNCCERQTPTKNKSSRHKQAADFSPCPTKRKIRSPRSPKRSTSSLTGSKRCFVKSGCDVSCTPSKQALWMDKIKPKLEKKKRSKCCRKSHPAKLPPTVQSGENEIEIIGNLLEQSNSFLQSFYSSDLKLVIALLEKEAVTSFENCLDIIKDCLQWFQLLIESKELKKSLLMNNKRIELMSKIGSKLSQLLNVLKQYVSCCSGIKATIPFDYSLYFHPNKCSQLALLTYGLGNPRGTDIIDKDYFEVKYFCNTLLNRKCVTFLNFAFNNCELFYKSVWKFKFKNLVLPEENRICIQWTNQDRNLNLVFDKEGENKMLTTASHTIKLVDDSLIWSQFQWKYIEGWKFYENKFQYSFSWFNRFNVTSLEYFASYARKIFFVDNWILYSTEAVFNKYNPKCELLWDRNGFDLLGSKIVVMRVLLKPKEEESWYFGSMRVNRLPCHSWQPFCQYECCLNWSTDDQRSSCRGECREKQSTNKEYARSVISYEKKSVYFKRSNQGEAEIKDKDESFSLPSTKVTDECVPKKKFILRNITSGKLKYTEEKQSSCSLQ